MNRMKNDESSLSYLRLRLAILKKSECALLEREELKRKEKEFRALAENSPDLIARMDRDFRYTYVNPSLVRESGIPEQDWIGRQITELSMPRELVQSRLKVYKKVLESRREEISEFKFGSGRNTRYFHVRTIPEVSEEGTVSSILSISREITDFKRGEQKLRRVHRALVSLSSCGRAITHAQSEDELLNNVCRVIVERGGYRLAWVGYPESDEDKKIRPVGQWGYEQGYLENVNVTWSEDSVRGRGPTGTAFRTGSTVIIRDTATDPRFAPWREEAAKRGYSSVIGIPLLAPEGGCGVLTIYAAEADAFDEGEVGLLKEMAADLTYGIMALRARKQRESAERELRKTKEELETRVRERTRELSLANEILEKEVSERRQIEQNLRISYEKLKSLTSELARVEENERKQIASDLHDRLGQNLAIAKLTLETMGGELKGDLRKQLDNAVDLLKDSIKDTRFLVKELSPQLFELGFIPAIEALYEQMREKYGIKIKFKGPRKMKIPDEIQSFLFRAIRELLINAVKHSGSKEIDINISRRPGSVAVRVKDYGRGFDSRALGTAKGFGLFSIRERLDAMGGIFRLDSSPQKGTLIDFTIPLR